MTTEGRRCVCSPILTAAYVRLAKREEHEARATFGERYARYAASTPAFVPHLGRRVAHSA